MTEPNNQSEERDVHNTPDATAIEVNGVGYRYTPGNRVLIDADAVLRPGRITAVVGPNAAGKTTLVKLLLGVLTPDQGSVTIDGAPIHKLDPQTRARWISYVPQRAGVRFGFTVRQIVAMGRFAAADDAEAHTDEVLAQLGLGDLSERAFETLSGGQQQRILLARAMAQSRGSGRIMLLDEPAGHLDLRHAHQTMRQLQAIAQRGLAVLVVVHDLNLALTYADDAWLMHQGRIIATGTWQEVLAPRILEPVYGICLTQIDGDAGGRPALLVQAQRD